MGVNAEAWIPNKLDLATVGGLPSRLNHACPPQDVWHWDQTDSRRAEPWVWDVMPSEESIAEGLCAIDGPGMMIHIHPCIMGIWSLARWRGFIQHPDLRTRVCDVTTKVALALGAAELIWLPEGVVDGIVFSEREKLTFDALRKRLGADLGPAQPSLSPVNSEVLAVSANSPPMVWFDETIR